MNETMATGTDGSSDHSPVRGTGDTVTITVRVQPRAGRNELVGTVEGALKVRLKAPPVDGEANAACVSFLSELLSVPRNAVQIVSGMTARQKIVRVRGLTADAAEAAIARAKESGRRD